MKKLLFVLLFIVFLISFSVVAYAQFLRPAGPGLGWYNDWWNPETQKIQNTPYIPSR